jgi:3-phosphoshikimate 1-carboxyvinyltransferase
LFVGNAGTAARFLTALLTLGKGEYTLDGDARMRQRPIGGLLDALGQLGAEVAPLHADTSVVCPPLKVSADGLAGGQVRIAGNISSQYLSALLMVAPYASASVDIELITELNSRPFVDMTLAVMADFGVAVSREGYQRFHIQPATYTPVDRLVVEPDASAASYFFAAPAICGGRVRVENMRRASRQGDIRFLDVLAEMGCQVSEDERGIQVSRSGELNGVDVDMRDIPDTAQTLAAIAPFAETPTRIHGIASARVKETDRISAVCAELGRLGVRVEENEDGMTIHPCGNIKPACVHTYNDHRMAMSFALIGLRADGIRIEDPGCVSKTFPDFFTVLEGLR